MNIFATLSYGCAAIAFLMLTALLVTSWRGRRQGAFVIVASAATAVWAGILAASNYFHSVPGPLIYYAEIGRGLAWILALSSIAGPRRTALAARSPCWWSASCCCWGRSSLRI